ncbi:MAG: hypothetical protein FJZ90_11100 [Chloroflexi bacterium]|nr:hypothetical protein [Chloroflexota bacterium]
MAYEALQAVVGTAIVDPKFRQGLLRRSPGILRGFGLTPEESRVISAIKEETLHGFANQLNSWISSQSAALA